MKAPPAAARVRSLFVCDQCAARPLALFDLAAGQRVVAVCPSLGCGADMRLVSVGGELDAVALPAMNHR